MRTSTIKTLTILFVVAFLNGVIDHLMWYFPLGIPLAKMALFIVTISATFQWYRQDSDRLNFKRTMPLNISIIAVGLLALPYYLYKTRFSRERVKALLVFFGGIAGWYLFYYAGFSTFLSMRGS